MRAGIFGLGMLLFVIGILMLLFFWPMMAYETEDTFDIEAVEGGETVRYVGRVTDVNESGGIFTLELDDGVLSAYTREEGFEEDQQVIVTVEFGANASNYGDNTYLVQHVPTTEGYIGLLITFIGLICSSAGAAAKKPRLEDIVKFEIRPPLQVPLEEEVIAGEQADVTTISAQSSALTQASSRLEQVTCPKCKKVFGVSGIQRPARIACPECGLEGVIE